MSNNDIYYGKKLHVSANSRHHQATVNNTTNVCLIMMFYYG
jgi:hypothetical protein